MSKVYLISDLHFAHKKILDFAGDYRVGDTVDQHNEILIHKWNSVVTKRDKVFVLGDVCMGGTDNKKLLHQLLGHKVLIKGNHDRWPIKSYLDVFENVWGIVKYKGFWLSHCPIHPAELRGCRNIHGHVHSSTIMDHYHQPDPRYINVCVEACYGFPVPFTDIVEGLYEPRV